MLAFGFRDGAPEYSECGAVCDSCSDEEWDRFVQNHPFGLICHLSEWSKILKNSFKHIKSHRLVIRDQEGNVRCGLPIYEVKSHLLGKRLVSIPFASLSDPLILDGEDFKTMFFAAVQLGRKNGCEQVELRTFRSQLTIPGLRPITIFRSSYLYLDKHPDKLMKSFHRSCVRQRIAKALSSGLEFVEGIGESDLYSFYKLHSITRKRLGLPRQPFRFFVELWSKLNRCNRCSLNLARKDGQVIAAQILFKYKNRVSAEFVAYDEKWRDVSPNHFLFWKAIEMACRDGYEIFDFGRTSVANQGLLVFKGRWGTRTADLPQLYYPCEFNDRSYDVEESWKYKLISGACRHFPEFIQGAIGKFCYRHLG